MRLLQGVLKTSAAGRNAAATVRKRKADRFVPSVTCLEGRLTPAAVNYFLADGQVYFYGTEGKDNVRIIYYGSPGDGYELQFKITPCTPTGTSCDWFVDKNLITQKNAFFYGFGGDDEFHGDGASDYLNPTNPLKVYAWGMEGNDTLTGGPAKDFLNGSAGDDKVYGKKANDRLLGEDGNDLLEGQDGDDAVFGAFDGYAGDLVGSDTLRGNNGNDSLYGGAGNDALDGGYGVDYVYGEDGNDSLIAGYDGEWNILDGGNGADYMYGGYGWDYIFGGAGNDRMYGNSGTDVMHGGNGNDYLYGQAGNDDLNGGEDTDVDYLYGGTGADWFKLSWYDYYPDINSEDEVYT